MTVTAESHYLWDNWVLWDDRASLFHRFSLAASRTLSPDERHLHATLHRWTSRDGDGWSYAGCALAPGDAAAFDGQAIWSGSTVAAGRRLALFYTGLARGGDLRQTISVAYSGGGPAFEKLGRPVLDPRPHPAYELGGGDVLMAWRDPFVFRHPDDGSWHMVFSAKRPGRAPRGAVGHAVARGGSLESWDLRPPLELPASHLQVECPQVVFRRGAVYCFASTKDRIAPREDEANVAFRAWRAPALAGPWEPAGRGGSDVVLDAAARVYAVSLAPWPGRGDALFATGFYTRGHPRAHTWVPWMPVDWDDGSPRLLH